MFVLLCLSAVTCDVCTMNHKSSGPFPPTGQGVNRNHPKQPMNLSVKPWLLRTPSVNAWLCLRDCGFCEYQQRINIPLPKSTCYYKRVFVTCNSQLHGQQAWYGSVVTHAWSQDKHTLEYYKAQSYIYQKSTPARCRRNSPCFTYSRMCGSWKPRFFINHGNNKNITNPKAFEFTGHYSLPNDKL